MRVGDGKNTLVILSKKSEYDPEIEQFKRIKKELENEDENISELIETEDNDNPYQGRNINDIKSRYLNFQLKFRNNKNNTLDHVNENNNNPGFSREFKFNFRKSLISRSVFDGTNSSSDLNPYSTRWPSGFLKKGYNSGFWFSEFHGGVPLLRVTNLKKLPPIPITNRQVENLQSSRNLRNSQNLENLNKLPKLQSSAVLATDRTDNNNNDANNNYVITEGDESKTVNTKKSGKIILKPLKRTNTNDTNDTKVYEKKNDKDNDKFKDNEDAESNTSDEVHPPGVADK